MKRLKNYSSDIDNLTHVKEVRNFMIGPSFAHQKYVLNDNNPYKFNRSLPIGIIQLINKKNFEKIREFDIEKFEAIQNLIGLSIEQTAE